MVKKCVLSVFLSIVISTLISGCASRPFVDPSLSGEKVTAGGIAVFPVILGRSVLLTGGVEAYCRDAGEEIALRIKKRQPVIKILSPSEVSIILNNENLVSDYSKLTDDYQKIGILSTVIAGKLAETLGVKYFVISKLVSLYPVNRKAIAILNTQVWSAERSQMVFECNDQQECSGFFSPPYDKAVRNVAISSSVTLTSAIWKK